MNIVVSTHQGQLLNDDVDYIVCKNEGGEFAIMKDHIPTVSVIGHGYLKLVLGKQDLFVAVNNGILEFKENKVTLIAQDAFIGRDKDNVKANLDKIIKQRLEANRASSVDFTEKERDLIDNIKKSGAGKL
jgi:F-type H+-transporting ATPase subunit epsilon